MRQQEADALRAALERMQSNCDNVGVEIADLRAEIEGLRADYASVCKLVADMHGAAMGVFGHGPIRGVVEDVADVRAELDALRISDRIKTANCEALRADAEAYRLIRRGQHWSVIDGLGFILCGEDLDAAIAARSKP